MSSKPSLVPSASASTSKRHQSDRAAASLSKTASPYAGNDDSDSGDSKDLFAPSSTGSPKPPSHTFSIAKTDAHIVKAPRDSTGHFPRTVANQYSGVKVFRNDPKSSGIPYLPPKPSRKDLNTGTPKPHKPIVASKTAYAGSSSPPTIQVKLSKPKNAQEKLNAMLKATGLALANLQTATDITAAKLAHIAALANEAAEDPATDVRLSDYKELLQSISGFAVDTAQEVAGIVDSEVEGVSGALDEGGKDKLGEAVWDNYVDRKAQLSMLGIGDDWGVQNADKNGKQVEKVYVKGTVVQEGEEDADEDYEMGHEKDVRWGGLDEL